MIESFSLTTDSSIISDKTVAITSAQIRTENVFRRIKLFDEKGKELILTTNRFDLSANEIADIYISRWSIELFFKWMQQHLSIKKFYCHSEQAIHNQIYVAMIAYCLNVLIQLNTNSHRRYLQISRYSKFVIWRSTHILGRKFKVKGVP